MSLEYALPTRPASWIPVTEALPAESITFLVWNEMLHLGYLEKGQWYRTEDNTALDDVTYWFDQLPVPPR